MNVLIQVALSLAANLAELVTAIMNAQNLTHEEKAKAIAGIKSRLALAVVEVDNLPVKDLGTPDGQG